ncbi:MAG: glutamate--tRNA ligase [Oscillospiraceae bacterium]|jgi:glutamyl-tRNA synthetase|nr:glutamate--tRNA ligase [Oscillospiraceae bacterium]
MKEVRTRFAPSPTGFMHLGGVRTALYAWLFAKKNGGKFILRIEDTDQKRYVEGAVEVIYETLRECGLNWDEGPYIQSRRRDEYLKYAKELVKKGEAYYCDCDGENCECGGLSLTSGIIRQRVTGEGKTSFNDEIYGVITVENSEIEEQVLIKSDGMPTYNFANVIDDHFMNITHVIRGNEFLSSTPKHVLLYKAFGWEPPVYIHCAQIMRDSSHKLSKRDGDAYFSDFRDKGYLTEAIINYIALLGWSPKGALAEREIFSLEELVEAFDAGGISKSPAIFDRDKLKAINAHYIRSMPPEKFTELAKPYIPKADVDYGVLCAALQQRTEVFSDIPPQTDFIERACDYEIGLYDNKKMKTSPETALQALNAALEILGNGLFSRDALYGGFKETAEKSERKIGWYLYPLQIALTGKSAAPGGGLDICVILGKDESLTRIKQAIKKIIVKQSH